MPFRTQAAADTTYTDPFAYCAAVGTIDAPDSRYIGEKVPMRIAKGLQQATGAQSVEFLLETSHWRCMEGKVYACTVGANIPCMSKANTSRTPDPAMREYCRNKPSGDGIIPMYVRDRASIYDWECRRNKPVITRQLHTPDARGFLSGFWYQIKQT
ncbi:MAG TPA: hypothetical protein VNT26_10580 [Candidatus Sulfotelmatobacter sp.]|nr:hypothetical protein [Candidatus Sulfotelmatobacter sp.]